MILESINSPSDLKALSLAECDQLAGEIRDFIVETVSRTGGHLGSNLGVVELTLALHRVFNSPDDIFLFDTGHQAYIHKLVTGRRDAFTQLKQQGGLSGYPSRAESLHDWVENSHASAGLSYAHGIATALRLEGRTDPEAGGRFVVAVVGDGALTGGMAYEALNNLGHSGARVLIVLNDNGRSYAPTVSKLSVSLTQLRLDPRYLQVRERVRHLVEDLPGGVSSLAFTSFHGLSAAVREVVEPRMFFEALGIRYTGPIDGHDIGGLEQSLRRAASWNGPIVLHVDQGEGLRPGRGRRHRLPPRHEGFDLAGTGEPPRRARAGTPRVSGERFDRRRRIARATWCRGELLGGLFRGARGSGGQGRAHRGDHGRHARPDRAAGVPGPLP
jgi:1-deoxy-D-xylulose-5-phosphate synthase